MTFDFKLLKKCKPDLSDAEYVCPLCKGNKFLTLKDSQKKVKCVCYLYINSFSVLGKDLYQSYEILDPESEEKKKLDLSSCWGKNSYFCIPKGVREFKPYLAQTIMETHSKSKRKNFRFAYEEFFELMQIYFGHRKERYSDLLDFISVNNAFFIRVGDTEMPNSHLDQALRQFLNIVSHQSDKFVWLISSHKPSSEAIKKWYGDEILELIKDFKKEQIK